MKKLTFLLIALMLIGVVSAEKVSVVNFNYDNGVITVKDRTVKLGHYPDKNYQPEEGYRVEVVDVSGGKLYSMRFKIPLKVFTDVSEGDGIEGSLIILNETDFSLIVPYFEEAKDIVFYNPRNYRVATLDISNEKFSPRDYSFIFYILGILVIIVIIIFVKKKYQYK